MIAPHCFPFVKFLWKVLGTVSKSSQAFIGEYISIILSVPHVYTCLKHISDYRNHTLLPTTSVFICLRCYSCSHRFIIIYEDIECAVDNVCVPAHSASSGRAYYSILGVPTVLFLIDLIRLTFLGIRRPLSVFAISRNHNSSLIVVILTAMSYHELIKAKRWAWVFI